MTRRLGGTGERERERRRRKRRGSVCILVVSACLLDTCIHQSIQDLFLSGCHSFHRPGRCSASGPTATTASDKPAAFNGLCARARTLQNQRMTESRRLASWPPELALSRAVQSRGQGPDHTIGSAPQRPTTPLFGPLSARQARRLRNIGRPAAPRSHSGAWKVLKGDRVARPNPD